MSVSDSTFTGIDGRLRKLSGLRWEIDLCYAVARYLANGSRDRSFSGDGIIRLAEGGATPTAIALAPNGKIVVTGGYSQALTIRLTARGRLDPSFGGRGVVERAVKFRFRQGEHKVVNLSLTPNAVLVGRDGSVLIAAAMTRAGVSSSATAATAGSTRASAAAGSWR